MDSLIEGTLPSEIGRMLELREFGVNGCLLTGTVPKDIYLSLDRLWALILQNNQLSGTVSSYIGRMPELSYTLLQKNQFTGTLPTQMGLLSNAKNIGLNLNNLTGSIPLEVCALRGTLNRLKADCAPASNTGQIPVFCPVGCCTKCCDQDTGTCQKVEDY